jgi:hypothetical protein
MKFMRFIHVRLNLIKKMKIIFYLKFDKNIILINNKIKGNSS